MQNFTRYYKCFTRERKTGYTVSLGLATSLLRRLDAFKAVEIENIFKISLSFITENKETYAFMKGH